jgi:hypothetical protein
LGVSGAAAGAEEAIDETGGGDVNAGGAVASVGRGEDAEEPGEGAEEPGAYAEEPGRYREPSPSIRLSPRASSARVAAAAPAKLSQESESKTRVTPTASFSGRTVKLNR